MQTQIDLSQFTGTENYYRHPFGKALFTDGVKYFAETAGAYWFIDIFPSRARRFPHHLSQGR
jgi:hypothetical protein